MANCQQIPAADDEFLLKVIDQQSYYPYSVYTAKYIKIRGFESQKFLSWFEFNSNDKISIFPEGKNVFFYCLKLNTLLFSYIGS